MLCVNGSNYYFSTPSIEKDLENKANKYFKNIFGSNSYYFDKFKLKTPAGTGSIPDGYVLSFSNDNESAQLYIIEYELSKKSNIHKHVQNQVSNFLNALNLIKTREGIINNFIKGIQESTLHQHIFNAFQRERYNVAIIIDEKSQKLEEQFNQMKIKPIILEFQTYRNGDNEEAYVFDCEVPESKLVIIKSDRIAKKSKQELEKAPIKSKEKKVGIMESIYNQVVEFLKQHPKSTYSEIIDAIPELQDKGRPEKYKGRPENYLWNVLDKYGTDTIGYTDDRPTKLYLITSDKQKSMKTTKWKEQKVKPVAVVEVL